MPGNVAAGLALTLELFKWRPIHTALECDHISSGDTPILAVCNTVKDGFYQVVYWDREACEKAGPPGSLGSGYGWSTMDQEIRYHHDFFTHWMPLMPAPEG